MRHFTKLSLIAATLICIAFSSTAQKNFMKDADAAFKNRQFFNAIELYKQAYTKAKKADAKAKILYRTGASYHEINDFKGAETYYQKAIAAKYADPEAILRLADCLKEQMKYPEAMTEYGNYKKANPSDPRGDLGTKSCELAQKWKDTPSRYKIENMALINTKDADFSAVYSDKKYTTLMFTSTREGALGKTDLTTGQLHSDLYETKLDKNGKWSTPLPLATNISTAFNEGAATVSKKGDLMFLTRCPESKGKKLGCEIFLAKKQGSGWAEPALLPFIKAEDSISFRHPAFSPDGQTLFFCSNMPGGYGASDIWMAHFDSKANSWGQPINLGATINTSGKEGYPYISDDGKFLYFSSDYHPGMGGLDIFKAEIGPNNKFSKSPENLKFPLNSAADDFGIIFEGKKQRGYFTSNREGGKGSDDIWSFYLPPLVFNLKGAVASKGANVNSKGKGEPVENAKIKLIGSNGNLDEFSTGKDGTYSFKLKEGVTYSVTVETSKQTVSASFKDGYLASKDMGALTTVGEMASKDFVKDFELTPVEIQIRLPEIQYDVSKWDLRPESKDSLNFLYQTLVDNPTIIVELNSHTDSRDNDKKNLVLSQNRAQSCVDYLVNEKKIPVARLKAVGKGETQLLVTDAVIKKAKTKEEKEAMHQKNRRTTFKILSWDFVDPNAPTDQPKPKTKTEEDNE